jgi:hypothetical protein
MGKNNEIIRKIFLFSFLFFIFIFPKNLFAQNPKVILNEIMWGSDKDKEEWIELKNLTNNQIDLTGWSIDNAKSSNKPLEIKGGLIPPGGYFLICKTNSPKTNCDYWESISLNNNYIENGKLILRDSNKAIIDQTPQPINSNWPAGKSSLVSMERKFKEPTIPEDGSLFSSWKDNENPSWQGSSIGLEANAGSSIITLTEKEITFDGSKSKGNIQNFIWNMGDGNIIEGKKINYSYNFPGKYIVTLKVKDYCQREKEDSIEVTVFSDSIFISEFSLTEKWIEIVNTSNFVQDISFWGISNQKDKIKYIFPEGSFISPGAFLVLKSELVGSLRNSNSGSLYLFYPSGDIRSQINYQKFNGSIARIGRDYFYTKTQTPASKNIISGETFGLGGNNESIFSTPFQTQESNSQKNNLENQGEQSNQPQKIGIFSENKEAKGAEPSSAKTLNKNLLSEVKNAKLPLLLGASIVILFSGTVGTGLAKLRKRMKGNFQGKKKIEVELEN